MDSGHLVLCDKPERLQIIFGKIVEDSYICENPCPYGDGKSAEKIKKILDAEG